MIKKITLIYLIFGFFCCAGHKAFSQINFSNPNITFTQACASSGFNNFNFSFSFFPPSALQPGNQFIVELSDSSGSFTSPTIVKVLTNTTSPVSSNFSLPTNAYGEGYRIRVRSTAPVKISNPSNAFAAYYAPHNQPFAINSNVGTVSICDGDTYTLQVDDTGTPASPVYYPSLTYRWYKDTAIIAGATGSSITVNEPGQYYAQVDYGSCNMNSYSNIVQVQVMSNLTPSISSQGNSTIICPAGTNTLTSSITSTSYTYQWYKDNVQITGATGTTYDAAEEGTYHLAVANGPCIFNSNTILLEELDFNLSVSPAATTTIIPGESLTILAIDDANEPLYQWYKDEVTIAGATASTYSATQPGVYKAIVTQATPCNIVKEAEVTLISPSGYNLAIQPAAAYTECTSASVTLNVTQFEANTSEGIVNLMANPYGYAYQWYKDDVAVTGATASDITISNAAQNGIYKLVINIPGHGDVTSNNFEVNVPLAPVAIAGDSILCEGSNVILTASVSGSAYNYQWYKEGIAIAGETATTLSATEEGQYYIIVTSGNCSAQSNTITLTVDEITVSSTAPETDVIIPGETKIITVTTDAVTPAFTWEKDGVPLTGTTATITATQAGTYTVEVMQMTGCNATVQKTFVLEYPSSFDLSIATAPGYISCTSATAHLELGSFMAITSEGNIDVTTMPYTYQWYKNDVAVAGATSATLSLNNASQNGTYKLGVTIPDFGEIFSNDILISLAVQPVTITNDTVLCEDSTVMFTASISSGDYTYQWYNNNTAIAGATASTYAADAEGDYHLQVISGECSSISNTINLTIAEISVSSTFPENDVILPGDTKTITVTTDAQDPVYSWTRNGVALTNTSATLNATQDGEYIVTVSQTTGCAATAQKTFTLEYPSGFDLTIAADASYAPCTSASATLAITSFSAITSLGNIDVTSAGYAYQWNLNGTAITGATSASFTVNDASQNGNYTLVVLIPGFEPVVSDPVNINLNIGTVDIAATGDICVDNPTVDITSNVNNAAYTYTWYKDGVLMTDITPALTVNETGDYYVVVNTGACTYTSNTVTVTEAEFGLTTGNITVEYVIPGETNVLSVSTDALSPQFEWYRNGVLIPGETMSSLTVTLDGEYKVVVTQTEGCTVSNEITFTVAYPTDFLVDIEAATYIPCNTTSTELTISDFSASTPAGPVDVPGNGYGYQWYLNDLAIAGATLPQHTAIESGDYYLEVVIPEIGSIIISNTISLQLGFEDDVEITADGVLCSEGGSVTLSSDANNIAYAYKWFNEADEVIGTESTVTVSEAGSYYLAITYQNCIITSNILDVEIFDMNQVTIDSDPSLSLLEGTTTTVTASGAESYEWFMNGTSIATGPTITINSPGSYSVVATVGSCQVTKVIDVTTRENNLIAIPNVITPNNDGINDKWVLPVQYAAETTEVVIYGPDGSIVFRASNYSNNWPESDFTYSLSNPVYYFTIMENNEITKRGSITLIK